MLIIKDLMAMSFQLLLYDNSSFGFMLWEKSKDHANMIITQLAQICFF